VTRADAERLLAGVELHRALGLELVEWGAGEVMFRFEPGPIARGGGYVHGGALVVALDTAACFALIAATGRDCTTVDLRTDFLRPASDPTFLVRGTVLRAGKRLGWADAALTAEDGRLIAGARGTFAPL
jgi:uncharacterized protein (TIGR00369 family)